MIAACICAGAAGSAGATQPGASSAELPVASGPRALYSSLHMFGLRIPSAAAAREIASRDSVIVVTQSQLNGYAPELRAANPNIRIYAYLNGMLAQQNEGTRFPASWYMRDRSGAKVRSRGWGNFLMDPHADTPFVEGGVSYPNWTSFVSARCQGMLASGVFDGCFLDMLGTAPLDGSYNRGGAVPLRGAGGWRWSSEAWLRMTGSVAAAVESSSGRPVIGNGLGNGTRYYSTTDGPSRLLYRHMSGGWAETWLRPWTAAAGDYPTLAAWGKSVQMLMDAGTKGRAIAVTVKLWGQATADQRTAWRQFALASYLLGRSGHAYFEYSPSRSVAPWAEQRSPLYRYRLGAPVHTNASLASYLHGGLYQRTFARGRVLVNPFSHAVTVQLPQAYRTSDGHIVHSMLVPPHRGRVLRTV